MVVFLRLKLITGDDLSTTLWTWHADKVATTEEFLRDLDSAAQTRHNSSLQECCGRGGSPQVPRGSQAEAGSPADSPGCGPRGDGKFIQFHLEELQSQQETRHLVVKLSSRITDHQSRVCEVLCSEPLRHAEVALLVLVGMAVDRPLESNFFPGLLEGLLGRLGIAAPGESKPPHHPGKVLATLGHQPCARRFYR